MSDFLTQWFHGFEEGIKQLDEASLEKLFRSCGRKCADTGIIKVYEDLYDKSGKDFDVFFTRLHELENISGKVVSTGEIYEITFPNCLCDLYTMGYISSDRLCECSRQSIIYVMNTLSPGRYVRVIRISSVLNGDDECRFRITFSNESEG